MDRTERLIIEQRAEALYLEKGAHLGHPPWRNVPTLTRQAWREAARSELRALLAVSRTDAEA